MPINTDITRRSLMVLAAAAALTPAGAFAQDAYPNGQITFICAFPAGSGADVLVRFFADKFAKVSGQTVIVENKPGAAGNIAAQYTARVKPDGYTIYVHSGTSTAANMSLFKNPPIDVVKELQTTSFINKQAFMFVVAYDSPIKDMKDLTAMLKQKGANASYATAATSGKVLGEVYKQVAGVEPVEVSFKDAKDSLNDMLSGAIDYGVHDPVFALSQANEKRMRILATGSPVRLKSIPDIPTAKEQGYDIDQLGWWGSFVPKATPQPIVARINALFNEILEQPDTVAFLGKFGGDVYIGTPDEGQALLAKTVDEWKTYVALAKIPQN
ncbi:tripartite-type tricarboxylate transporter receptor subunit TctC [Rhizobium petrolearium]|uniref:Bug family tripartite tricarboxylate transporter substrate binding protein n=1 Tax=Neorhizobium petrolearium TaxID=515361 RepID=UPI001F29E4D9|nr:tripartite tricarboxylate transporter substrate binding protein [Neorhizobium petrolearium]MBP1845797.1 tripartite-type tricarboxylate transporter receptor subunit TctC [Neorhizobium petrolearium]